MQRVERAEVRVDGDTVAAIGTGLLVLVGVTHSDTAQQSEALARKVRELRILRGERSVADTPNTGVLVVSQFTLYADTRKGRRPSWSAAAPAAIAEPLIVAFTTALRQAGVTVKSGRFGADMQVDLVNDGPVTVLVEM